MPGRAIAKGMGFWIRFAVSLAIPLWGLTMILLGILDGFFLWIAIGATITAVGLPLLGSHPWMTRRLYPTSGNIEGAAPPAPQPPSES